MSNFQNHLDFSSLNSREVSGPCEVHHHPGLDWIASLTETNEMMARQQEVVLIGRADHYRLGEMLMPHVLARLIHVSKIRCAGLFGTDQTMFGGHSVRNYGECLLEMRGAHLQLIHTGGDILGIDLVEGYAEAAPEEEAERFRGLMGVSSREDLYRYARRRTGQISDFAYVLEASGEFTGAAMSFHSVGLSSPESLGHREQDRLLSILRRADFVGVRDARGATFLEDAGISVERMPCVLSVFPQVCARQLREIRDCVSLQALRSRFPNGWIAVEVSHIRECDGDRLAKALRELSEGNNLGLVFFEAEKSSDLWRKKRIRQWVEAFPEWQSAEFTSLNIWEVASMVLHSRLYCGSSLDVRSLCMSGGIPRINLPVEGWEVQSYCSLWEDEQVPVELSLSGDWTRELETALSVDFDLLQKHATGLQDRYRQSFDKFCASTGIDPRLVVDTGPSDHEKYVGRLRQVETAHQSRFLSGHGRRGLRAAR